MTPLEQMQRAFDRLAEQLTAYVQAVAEFTPVSKTSADGASDAVNVQGDPKDRQRSVRRFAPWGIMGRPVAGGDVLAAVVKAVAGAFGGMALGIATSKYGPQNLEEGETCLYCKADGTRVFLDKDGNIRIDCAAGKDVIINGGSAKVGRVGDHVGGGSLAVIMGTGPLAASVASVVYVDADGVTHTLTTGNLGPASIKEKIQEGADHVKG